HLESGVSTTSAYIRHINPFDSRRGWPSSDRALESIKGLSVAFGRYLHSTIGRVANPSVQPFAHGLGPRKVAEADALHPTSNQIAASESHGKWSRNYSAGPIGRPGPCLPKRD